LKFRGEGIKLYKYVNYGTKTATSKEYKIALVDCNGLVLMWYKGFYNHKTNDFKLYPGKLICFVPKEYIEKKVVSVFDIINKKEDKPNELK